MRGFLGCGLCGLCFCFCFRFGLRCRFRLVLRRIICLQSSLEFRLCNSCCQQADPFLSAQRGCQFIFGRADFCIGKTEFQKRFQFGPHHLHITTPCVDLPVSKAGRRFGLRKKQALNAVHFAGLL